MVAPALPLYGYQKRWIADKSRFKLARITRQGGKSTMLSLDSVLESSETGVNEIILSAGERQSKEVIEKAKQHCEAMQIAASSIEETFFEDAQCKQLSIVMPNRARIMGLPANPATARGFTGNVRLDEFAIHKDSEKIWTALFPVISRGYKLSVLSTPQGKQNRFYRIDTGSPDNGFSKHVVDIYQAVKEGLPFNIAELRAALDDEDAWAQEYEVQFLDEATAFLTYDLISGCENIAATESLAEGLKGEFYLGIDVGRKRDLTVVWIVEKLGDVYWTRAVVTIEKTAFSVQQQLIEGFIRQLSARRTCIDATGIGMMLAERLGQIFGTSVVEPVMFTNLVKQDLAVRTRHICEDQRVRIPIAQAIRNDLHSVKKTVTSAGNIRFDAERTKDGHADRFWALSLALMASDEGVVKPELIMLDGDDE